MGRRREGEDDPCKNGKRWTTTEQMIFLAKYLEDYNQARDDDAKAAKKNGKKSSYKNMARLKKRILSNWFKTFEPDLFSRPDTENNELTDADIKKLTGDDQKRVENTKDRINNWFANNAESLAWDPTAEKVVHRRHTPNRDDVRDLLVTLDGHLAAASTNSRLLRPYEIYSQRYEGRVKTFVRTELQRIRPEWTRLRREMEQSSEGADEGVSETRVEEESTEEEADEMSAEERGKFNINIEPKDLSSIATLAGLQLSIWTAVAKSMLEQEPDEVKAEIEAAQTKAKADHKKASEAASSRADGDVIRTPEEYFANQAKCSNLLQTVIDWFAVQTGWVIAVQTGGPSAHNGGKVEVMNLQSATHLAAGLRFSEWDSKFHSHCAKPFYQYLCEVFPPENCAKHALGYVQQPATASNDDHFNAPNGAAALNDATADARAEEPDTNEVDAAVSIPGPDHLGGVEGSAGHNVADDERNGAEGVEDTGISSAYPAVGQDATAAPLPFSFYEFDSTIMNGDFSNMDFSNTFLNGPGENDIDFGDINSSAFDHTAFSFTPGMQIHPLSLAQPSIVSASNGTTPPEPSNPLQAALSLEQSSPLPPSQPAAATAPLPVSPNVSASSAGLNASSPCGFAASEPPPNPDPDPTLPSVHPSLQTQAVPAGPSDHVPPPTLTQQHGEDARSLGPRCWPCPPPAKAPSSGTASVTAAAAPKKGNARKSGAKKNGQGKRDGTNGDNAGKQDDTGNSLIYSITNNNGRQSNGKTGAGRKKAAPRAVSTSHNPAGDYPLATFNTPPSGRLPSDDFAKRGQKSRGASSDMTGIVGVVTGKRKRKETDKAKEMRENSGVKRNRKA